MSHINVDFSKIPRDCFGQIETPQLILQTKSGGVICPIGRYFNLNMKLKFNEKSEIEFDVPAWADGIDTPFYDRIVPDMLVKIEHYGVFALQSISTKGNGIKEIKSCTANSLECELEGKQIVLGDGTYKFYDPVNPQNTILDICMKSNRSWKIGSVPARLYSVYRTFKQTDTSALDFMLNQVQEPFQCAFVFDTFTRTVNVIDALEEIDKLPIYISFQNLIKEATIKSEPEQFATRFTVNGADGVNILPVNPTGTNQIINLSYWIEDGSIPPDIASRYRDWKVAIQAKQPYYTSLVALKNSTYGQYLTEKARLTDLESELTSLDNLRSVNIQGLNMAKEEGGPTQEGTRQYFQANLDEIAKQHTKKQAEIAAQKAFLESIDTAHEQIKKDISSVNNELGFEKFFTQEELSVLDHYLKDAKISDSTFAVFDVDISGTDDSFVKPGKLTIAFDDVSIVDVKMDAATKRRILDITGGRLTITGRDYALAADIARGTFDKKDSGEIVFSVYLGSGKVNESSFPSGSLSCVGTSAVDVDSLLSGMKKVVDTITDEETGITYDDVSYTGGGTISISSASVYFTRNVTEYQKYSVCQDLYDYALDMSEKMAYPLYAFEVNTGNFIWAEEFEPFKNSLKLGGGIYLQLSEKTLLQPMLLEIHLSFENPSDFELVFSSEFQTKWPDMVSSFGATLKKSKDAAATLNFERNNYNSQHLSGAAEAFSSFWKNGLDTAYHQLTAGPNQDVEVGKAGIKVKTPGSSEYIMLGNGMLALVDDIKNTAKMAMGHFYNAEYGTDYYGVMADVVFGRHLVGNGYSIACPDINGGGMLFEADGKGVRLHNSRFSLDHDRGGQIILDPTVGFALGQNGMFEFDDDGKVVFNESKANAYIDMNGKLRIKSGIVDGDFYANNLYFNDGGDVKTLLDQATKKFDLSDMDYIDLGGIQLDGKKNNINFSGAGSITYSPDNAPNKQRFAASTSGPWHPTMQDDDIYCCDWNYTTDEWGAPYKKVGQDGKPGSDANVNYANVKSALNRASKAAMTIIDGTSVDTVDIHANNIYGGNIYAGEGSDSFARMQGDGLSIYGGGSTDPQAQILSVNNGNSVIVLLGDGDGPAGTADQFLIRKNHGETVMTYSGDGINTCGFTFKKDGKIYVNGQLIGGNVVAVFGEE